MYVCSYIDLKGLQAGEQIVEVKARGEDATVSYVPRVKEIKIKISKSN